MSRTPLGSVYEKYRSKPPRGRMLHVYTWVSIGGVETYIRNMLKVLPEYNHQILIKTPPFTNPVIDEWATLGMNPRFYYSTGANRIQEYLRGTEPTVVVYHGDWGEGDPTRYDFPDYYWVKIFHGWTPRWYDQAHQTVIVAENNLSRWEGPTAHKKKVRVISGGVDKEEWWLPRDTHPKKFVVGRYGSDRREKYAEDTVEIYEAVRAPETYYHIVGGELHKEQMARRGLEKNTVWLQPSMTEKYSYVQTFDCAVYRTSRRYVEALGLAVVEMQMAGVPVVLEAKGGVQEIVEDGVTGFVVPWQDKQQFAEKVRWLRENPAARWEMGEAARVRAETRYGLEQFRSKWLEVLQTQRGA